MSELRNFIEALDDDYLIGLSNKGIVKRSYKDLEKETVTVEEDGETMRAQVGDVQVELKLPLTQSTCSCPSVGMCKHIVMTILAAKKNGGGKDERDTEETGSAQIAETVDDTEAVVSAAQTEKQETVDQSEKKPAGDEREKDPDNSIAADVSLERLKKAVDEREFFRILRELKTGESPRITSGSIVTVSDQTSGMTVKLTNPIEYSTCTCHSNRLCRHKVKAILALKLQSGAIKPEELDHLRQEEAVDKWNQGQILQTLSGVKKTLGEILMTGSIRLAPEMPVTLERHAISCHNEGLALWETKLRTLSDLVKSYQERHASVTATALLHGASEIYGMVVVLEDALDKGEDITELAGEFRSEYSEAGELVLAGLGMRHFVSKAGYEGDILYFLETNTREWYTYTVARPTFYEKNTRRRTYGNTAPWGLNGTLSQIAASRIRLQDAKANAEHRLSATSQASAELLGPSVADAEFLKENVWEDFATLWEEYSYRYEKRQREALNVFGEAELYETDRLFLIRPSALVDMDYDEIRQRLVFYLEDKAGRRLRAQLTYEKEEAAAIRSLERLRDRIERKKTEIPVFLGSLYVEEGECVLYPIETIDL